jgi:hypothetical protein
MARNRIRIKICSCCGNEGSFTIDRQRKDGLDNYCVICKAEKGKVYHESDHGKKVRRKYLDSERRKESQRKFSKYAREKYPEKNHARLCVSNAIASGKLIRPSVCSIDNEDCKGRIEGHHEDYSKPLDVIWLCKYHHIRRHKELVKEDLSFEK